jgi:hypothetical protein
MRAAAWSPATTPLIIHRLHGSGEWAHCAAACFPSAPPARTHFAALAKTNPMQRMVALSYNRACLTAKRNIRREPA